MTESGWGAYLHGSMVLYLLCGSLLWWGAGRSLAFKLMKVPADAMEERLSISGSLRWAVWEIWDTI